MILRCLELAVGSFVVIRRPNNASDANYLDVTLVRSPYCLGHAEALMATRLSPTMRNLHGSQPRNSLLHLDYAICGSSTLNHTCALIRIVHNSSVNNFIILCRQKLHVYTLVLFSPNDNHLRWSPIRGFAICA